MMIDITSKHMDITPAIRQHIEKQLKKLDKWKTHLINPHIVLSVIPKGFSADARISTPNGPLIANAEHNDMYTAINDLVWKLERQLNRVQHKSESRRAYDDIRHYDGVTEDDNIDIVDNFDEQKMA